MIKDEGGHIFGGFASDSWTPHKKYYGNGDCFLYTFHAGERIEVYSSSFVNDFYMISDWDGLSMGSGGDAGLFIGKNLESGYSLQSDTYNNDVLSDQFDFKIMDMELWALSA